MRRRRYITRRTAPPVPTKALVHQKAFAFLTISAPIGSLGIVTNPDLVSDAFDLDL
jgi:hypothetical protein